MPIPGNSVYLCLNSTSLCMCMWYLYCLALLKKVPRWHFFEQSAQKAAHLLACAQIGECLCDEGLSEKSRLVEFVFCSPYTPSQLRDMTDKSTTPLPPHLPLHVSCFLWLLLCVSSLSALLFTLGWGWGRLLYWKWPSSDVNFLTTSSPPLQQSHKPKGQFFFSTFPQQS